MTMNKPEAYALVEVLGASHAVQAVDQMLKCATLELSARETSCGGHVTVVLEGDISACQAAVDSVRENPPCPIFGACVISGPSDELFDVVTTIGEKMRKS